MNLLLASVIVVLHYAILPVVGRYLKISPAPAGRISRLPSSFDLEESYVYVSLGFSDCHWIRPNDIIKSHCSIFAQCSSRQIERE